MPYPFDEEVLLKQSVLISFFALILLLLRELNALLVRLKSSLLYYNIGNFDAIRFEINSVCALPIFKIQIWIYKLKYLQVNLINSFPLLLGLCRIFISPLSRQNPSYDD